MYTLNPTTKEERDRWMAGPAKYNGILLRLIADVERLHGDRNVQSAAPSEVKSAELLGEFTGYCLAHPEKGFWDALWDWNEAR